MITEVAAYDYCAFILLVIIFLYYFRANTRSTRRERIMTVIGAITMAASLLDAVIVHFAKGGMISYAGFMAANSLYLLLISSVPPLYLLYILATTDTWHKLKRFGTDIILYMLPITIFAATLVVNLFNPIAFEIGEGGLLIRHGGYYMVFLVFIVYVALSIAFLRQNVYRVDRKRFYVLLIPMLLVLTGLLVRGAAAGHHVVCFTVSMCILMLVLINRRVEDSIDIVTGMHTYKVFAEDMNTNFRTGKQMEIILINILNFKYATRIAGYDGMLGMMAPVSAEIIRIMKKYHAQFMCYYNGDGKFAVELSKKSFTYANEIAGEIARSIRQNIKMEIADFELDINTCLVRCPDDVSDIESLFMLISDIDLVSTEGRVVSAATITGTKEFTMKKEMSTIIDRALTNHYFSVFYQPIYDTKTKTFRSAEALLRLRDPKYGYISPGLFIPMAEKSGAIHAIGSFVLEEVIKFIASDDFRDLGIDYIEINLSVMQCLRNDLADEIIDLAKKYRVSPQKVNLEITETADGYMKSRFGDNLLRLVSNGFTISLDDFGTGYSNLMRIAQLPLSIVKLDRTFVIMEENGGNHVIIKNLIEMLKDMDLTVLIEGVETEEMVDSFIRMGVDEIQGFYYSRPLTQTAFVRFLKDSAA